MQIAPRIHSRPRRHPTRASSSSATQSCSARGDDILSRLSGWEVTVDAEVGRSTVGGLEVLQRERARIGDIVVVHLGHNDGASRATFRSRIDAVMDELAGVDRVLWLNLAEFDQWVPATDEELAAAPARWPNLEIVEWRSVAASDPAYLYSDGIHLPPPGRRAMADLIGESVDSWVASRGPAALLTLRFGLHDPGRPRPAGFLPGPPVAVAPFGAGWRAVDGAGNLLSSGGTRGRVTGRDVAAIASRVAITATGDGYWLASADGAVLAFGDAGFYGDTASRDLAAPIVAMTASPSGRGYWLLGGDGGVFAFGDAPFRGSAVGAGPPGSRAIGLVPAPDGYTVVTWRPAGAATP